jgi:hypothetical protein
VLAVEFVPNPDLVSPLQAAFAFLMLVSTERRRLYGRRLDEIA